MEDVQYHLNGLFRVIKKNLKHFPESELKAVDSAANATQRALDELKTERKKYAAMVRKMREGQKAYFKATREKDYAKSQPLLSASRMNESEVDDKTEQILSGVMQPDLFK